MSQASDCSIPGCGKPARKLGYCHAHYRRHRLGQPMDAPVRSWGSDNSCSIDGCHKPAKSRGYCPAHYLRFRLGKPLDPPLRPRRGPDAQCEIEGCSQRHRAGGLCAMHWQRRSKNGDAGAPERQVAPAGSGCLKPTGYRVFRIDGVDIPEHRLVMERVLDRKLEPFETVHHKNGLRADNRPENLELWVTPQPYGQRPEDLVAWVVQHYPDLVVAEQRARKQEQRTGQLRLTD